MPVKVENEEAVLENAKEYSRKPRRIEDSQEVLKRPPLSWSVAVIMYTME